MALALCLSGPGVTAALGADVAVQAIMGDRALIAVDGGRGRLLRPGEAHAGVRLLEIQSGKVVVELAGRKQVVPLGGRVNARATAATRAGGVDKAVLHADGKGHFSASGAINGIPATLLVDTGASVVALPRSLALQAGVRLDDNQRALIHTANGRTPAWHAVLNSVQVGDIRLNLVEAVVVEDRQLPFPLLGMSFLNRTDMHREGDQLTLVQRY
jgi:aspartyl protease family protein